jgi:hypothetical protein
MSKLSLRYMELPITLTKLVMYTKELNSSVTSLNSMRSSIKQFETNILSTSGY